MMIYGEKGLIGIPPEKSLCSQHDVCFPSNAR